MTSIIKQTPPDCAIYALDSLWWGVSVGGRHYTGMLKWYSPDGAFHRHELERKLTLKEAKELGDTQVILWTSRFSRVTNRFDSLDQLCRAAARFVEDEVVKTNGAIKNWILIDNDIYNPNRPIAAAGWLKPRMGDMRKLAKEWDKVSNYIRENDKELWDAVYEAWDTLLTPPENT